jgi:hypothetical protein
MNENSIAFNARTGHNHDGVNSAPISLAEGIVELRHLSAELLDYLNAYTSGGFTEIDNSGTEFAAVPDLMFTLDELGVGEEVTGEVPWVSQAIVKYLRVSIQEGAMFEITFYHDDSYENSRREFKATECTAEFLWEGLWGHSDETETGKLFYRIKNIGTVASDGFIELKSSTMVANRLGTNILDDIIDDNMRQNVSSAMATAYLVFTLAGGSYAQYAVIFEDWLGIPAGETVIMTMTVKQYLQAIGMLGELTTLALAAMSFSTYVNVAEEIGTLDGSGNVVVPVSIPSADEPGYYAYDSSSLLIFAMQVEVDTGSPTNFFFDIGDPRIFGAPINPLGKGGIQTTFGYIPEGGITNVNVSVPGATSGSVYITIGLKQFIAMSSLRDFS